MTRSALLAVFVVCLAMFAGCAGAPVGDHTQTKLRTYAVPMHAANHDGANHTVRVSVHAHGDALLDEDVTLAPGDRERVTTLTTTNADRGTYRIEARMGDERVVRNVTVTRDAANRSAS
ncbi:hypothetical protein MBEHAL_1578 [Halarchaeum acidiphilum MH1-52-1]|uniref:Ig-like domain-containing protein n=2 Tax=Halarchaeum acidiphilum TaxID=489138 RepID=U3ADI7_9EURY|nr:hypothetical protein [Halarchaeum acidiphilum]GAD52818.1 hypothetical protein MBEHAL_1578 [Halarchaeum acidiphilum MH1-52-1]